MESLFDLLWGENPIDPNEGLVNPLGLTGGCNSSSLLALCGDGSGNSGGNNGGQPGDSQYPY